MEHGPDGLVPRGQYEQLNERQSGFVGPGEELPIANVSVGGKVHLKTKKDRRLTVKIIDADDKANMRGNITWIESTPDEAQADTVDGFTIGDSISFTEQHIHSVV